MTQGRFIVFDGVEGSGKSTQLPRAAQWIADRFGAPLQTREPGGTPLAEEIRELCLKDHRETLPNIAELLLMFAARSVHLSNRILPALTAGQWVLSDRFVDASYAYQGAGQGMSEAQIAWLEAQIVASHQPDCVFIFDLPPEELQARVRQRGNQDRFDRASMDFHERVRASYLARADEQPERYTVVDASQSIETVTQTVCDELERRFGC